MKRCVQRTGRNSLRLVYFQGLRDEEQDALVKLLRTTNMPEVRAAKGWKSMACLPQPLSAIVSESEE